MRGYFAGKSSDVRRVVAFIPQIIYNTPVRKTRKNQWESNSAKEDYSSSDIETHYLRRKHMRNYKKIIALATALTLFMGLAACGGTHSFAAITLL